MEDIASRHLRRLHRHIFAAIHALRACPFEMAQCVGDRTSRHCHTIVRCQLPSLADHIDTHHRARRIMHGYQNIGAVRCRGYAILHRLTAGRSSLHDP